MNNPNKSTIEQALTMYKETVSPSEKSLQVLLSQIPEQKRIQEGRAIRSPYIWVTFTQVFTLACILLVMYPALSVPSYETNPFYAVDQQIAQFEETIDEEDMTRSMLDYQ